MDKVNPHTIAGKERRNKDRGGEEPQSERKKKKIPYLLRISFFFTTFAA